MSGDVFANGREISGGATSNQSVAATPDVCWSPPDPTNGPVTIPYSNSSRASNTDLGSLTVKVKGAAVGLRDQSYYRTSEGNEAATRNYGMGIISATIQGKTYFASWSMDVMVEGFNVTRHLDLTTHNHASPTFNAAMTTNGGACFMAGTATDGDCAKLAAREEQARKDGPAVTRAEGKTHTAGHYKYKDQNGNYQYRNLLACSTWSDSLKKFNYAVGVGQSSVLTHPVTMWVKTVLAGDTLLPQTNVGKAKCTGAAHKKSSPKKGIQKKTLQKKTLQKKTLQKKFRVSRKCPGEADSNLCGKYEYKSRDSRSKSAHTESRMIEEIFKGFKDPNTEANVAAQSPGTLGTLIMSIHWNTKDGVSDQACPDCQDLICKAQECGLEVKLCQANDKGDLEPTSVACPGTQKDDGK